MKQEKLWVLAIAMTALLTTACGGSKDKELRLQADQIMEATDKAKDYDAILAKADSLEKAGVLSPTKANYWRGYACDRQKQKDKGNSKQ